MRIPGAQFIPPLPASMPKETLLQNLRPGQLLQATALSENRNGSIELRIGIARLIAQTQVAVRPGQSLTLQVESAGELPELRLLQPPSLRQQQAAALKRFLPRQQPITLLLDKLLQLTANDSKIPLPTKVRQTVHALLMGLPSPDRPDFKLRLLDLLQNNGLFTEARLLNNTSDNGDLKLTLLRLFRLVETSLSQRTLPRTAGSELPTTSAKESLGDSGLKLLDSLLKQIDAGLARIQTHQLSSLPQDDVGRQIWQFELPVLHDSAVDPMQILIERDKQAASADEKDIWSLTLKMNLPPLGALRVHLILQGDAISTILWAERKETTKLLHTHLNLLHEAYVTAGLEVKKLETHQGRIEPGDPIRNDLSLLNEKA